MEAGIVGLHAARCHQLSSFQCTRQQWRRRRRRRCCLQSSPVKRKFCCLPLIVMTKQSAEMRQCRREEARPIERDREGAKGREKEENIEWKRVQSTVSWLTAAYAQLDKYLLSILLCNEYKKSTERNIQREIEKERSNRSTRRRSKDLTAYWLWQLQHFTWIAETWVFVACICFQQKKNERERDKQRGRERERGRKQVRSDSRWANERKLCSPFKSRLALK